MLVLANNPIMLKGIKAPRTEPELKGHQTVEEKLRLLESAISVAHEGFLVVNSGIANGSAPWIEYANPGMQTMCSDSLIGKPIKPFMKKLEPVNLDLAKEMFTQLIAGQSTQAIFELNSESKGRRWLDLCCEPILDSNGVLTRWVGVVRDITVPHLAILLEQDRSRILEVIGRNAPITEILTKLALMLERQIPNSYVAVFRIQCGRFTCQAAPSFPIECQVILNDHLKESATIPALPQSFTLFLGSQILSASGTELGTLSLFFKEGSPLTPDMDCIKSAVNLAGIVLEHRQMTDALAYQAKFDSLTGLPNRNQLEFLIPQLIAQAQRQDASLAFGFLDLDRFKQINDSLGHVVGDLLLGQIGDRLRKSLLPSDFLARFGGDEFVVVMKDFATLERIEDRGRSFLDAFEKPFQVEGYELHLSASMGVSVYPKDGNDFKSLLRQADHAMYRAKNLGKNELYMSTPASGTTPVQRLEMESDLRRAIENRQLFLNYHPLLKIGGELHGFEVLLSWQHPQLGRIAPLDFIPIAEDSGLIIPIGTWVLQQACLQSAAWLQAGYAPVQLCVNVSSLQFSKPDFVDVVASALAVSLLDPRLLTLEITESLIMSNLNEASKKMSMLRAIGVGIAIDDFGTGYSSLNYLRQLPADQLKIDQSFLKEMTSASSSSYSVIKTITTLAHSLRLKVIVEGVETSQQWELLQTTGCDFVQGHLFGEPLAAHLAEHRLNKQLNAHAVGTN